MLPLYILDDDNAGDWRPGGASRWWLRRSLDNLNDALDGKLLLASGDAQKLLPQLVRRYGASAVYWNRCYEPWRIRRDSRIKKALKDAGIAVRSFKASLLWEPAEVLKADGSPYRVFTPFYRNACLQNAAEPREPLPQPGELRLTDAVNGKATARDLLPAARWQDKLESCWSPGEQGAAERLQRFLERGIRDYADGRDRPAQASVSRLSPHLHFGELSPNQAWHGVRPMLDDKKLSQHADSFLSELGWREFSCSLLYHWPELTSDNLQRKFNRFPWRDDPVALRAWQQGQTGYPIIDAGMRELWQTGYMHNRVRMLVGSFLVKNLLLHWRHGAEWFWDTLVDADLANNSASWQWVAGSGADAAPYFRIFNPVTQSRKFDPSGDYLRRYLPELSALPDRHIHCPWEAPPAIAEKMADYPAPIVELKESRERALAAFKSLSA